MAEAEGAVQEPPFAVWPPVADRIGHALQHIGRDGRPVQVEDADDTAHGACLQADSPRMASTTWA